MSDKDLIKEATEAFKVAEDADRQNRDRALGDLRFARLGEQWPQEIKKSRERDFRPCLVVNTLPAFIRQVVNDGRQNKPQPKVRPVDDSADVETAKYLDGIIRNIEHVSRADIAYDTALEHSASMNRGYIRVDLEYATRDSFDMDIKINRVVNPLTIHPDPYGTSVDGSDWNTCFVSEMLTENQFRKQYPKAETASFISDSSNDLDELWFEDKTIRVAEYWKREKVIKNIYMLSSGITVDEDVMIKNKDLFLGSGLQIINQRETESFTVKQYILTAKEVLSTYEWPGIYIPIIPVVGEEVNENGKMQYYSLIHHAKDAQRNKNYWRSAATELVALAPRAPFIGKRGSFDADPRWKSANTANHPYLEYDGEMMPQRQPFAGVPAGSIQEALNASDDVKAILGMYDASLGARSNETSGKAIMARQREGDVSTFHFIDNLNRSIRQVGAIILDLIPHVYNSQRILRVMGEDGSMSDLPINQQVMVTDRGVMPQQQAEQQQLQGISRVFDLSVGKYDISVSAGASYTTRREEAAVQMMELIRTMPETASVIADLLAKNLDWPGADEIAERLKSINPYIQQKMAQSDPQKQQQQQAVMMMQQQMAMAELKVKMAEAQLKQADAILKTKQAQEPSDNGNNEQMARLMLDKYRAEQDMAMKMREMEMDVALEREKLYAQIHAEKEKVAMQEQTKLEMHYQTTEATTASNSANQENDKAKNDDRMDSMASEMISRLDKIEGQLRAKRVRIERNSEGDMVSAKIESDFGEED